MQTEQLVALILSPLTASALVALLRRHVPKLDGPYLVPSTVVLLSIVGNVLTALQGAVTWQAIVNAAVAGIVGGLTAAGIVTVSQNVARKSATAVEPPSPAPKPITSDELADAVLKSLDKD